MACKRFGEVVYEAEIKMGADRPRNYQLPAEIDFHTDHVCAEIVAWHCLSIEPGVGAMRFLDLGAIGDSIGEQADSLSRVGIADNAAWGGGEPIPMALPREQGLRYHYVPWLRKFPKDASAGAALNAFEEAFAQSKQTDYVEVDIETRTVAFFLDNHRIAHGRGEISSDSPRNLTRFWVNSQGMQPITR